MSVWAIVPVKPFREAKSRLASLLSADERAALSRDFLAHTLDVLLAVKEIKQTLVVSRDTAALQLARKHGAHTVTESGAPELNAALTRATDVAVSFGADGVLVLPSDLPLLAPDDVLTLLAANGSPECVSVAPDRRDDGTNALFMRPPRLIPYAFGPQSFSRHVAVARERGLCIDVRRTDALALDVDLPEDLEIYQSSQPPNHPTTQPPKARRLP
ncbi:MAG: 2-phospho-L-lactate guanylyltransferase [Chloroflexi bacterium]|nr:2-phospho-L-lactate guanylyltransferase [Chloroflexota bacterium]